VAASSSDPVAVACARGSRCVDLQHQLVMEVVVARARAVEIPTVMTRVEVVRAGWRRRPQRCVAVLEIEVYPDIVCNKDLYVGS
jgi:hypothetical protein